MNFTRNDAQKRYEGKVDDLLVKLEYIVAQDKIYLTHTEVPKELEGKGIGSKIVAFALNDIEESKLKLVPLCPFVALYLKRHPEWLRLVMDGVNVK